MVDLILVNGDVQTLDSKGTQAEAVAVRNGRIAAIGTTAEVKGLTHSKTEIIYLKGKTVLPGFIDAHNHMTMFGLLLSEINCQDGKIKSIAELLDEIACRTKQKRPGEWISAWGYDDTKFLEKRHPTRWDLDRFASEHPVVCKRTCGHMMVVNSKALELAGITRETPDPPGGEISRDANGEPAGMLKETAQDIIKKAMPEPGTDTLREALKQAGALYNKEGITSVHEAGAGFTIPGPSEVRGFQSALIKGDLSVRVYMMVYTELLDELIQLGFHTGFGNDFLKIGCFKMFLDGGIGGKTAAMEEPYEGDVTRGIIYESEESLTEKMRKAHQAGFQLGVHAIGDRALHVLLNAYEKILLEYPRQNHRHRIEHFTLSTPSIIERARKLNLLPVPQVGFIYYLGESWIENLGQHRVQDAFPLRSLLEAGFLPPGSSDRPVIPGNPLRGIEAAVLRRTFAGRTIAENQAVSVDQALRMYTNYGAYASFEEDRKGSIEVGKFADLVVLGSSPYQVLPQEISSIPVELTIVDGKVVYQSHA